MVPTLLIALLFVYLFHYSTCDLMGTHWIGSINEFGFAWNLVRATCMSKYIDRLGLG